MTATQTVGRYGEDVAARYLEELGFTILDRNWRSTERECPGELDIVAFGEDCLVFCEVKTRRSVSHGSPAEAVTRDKARRLRRLAMVYLRATEAHAKELRIDVISVLRPISGPARITHLRGIA